MTWRLEWTDLAAADLKRIHWRTAGRLCKAVATFASTGEGDARRLKADPLNVRVHVRGAFAIVHVDGPSGILHVVRAFARKL